MGQWLPPNFEFCRRRRAAVTSYGGSSGGIMRIETKGIFAANYAPVKHSRRLPQNGATCSPVRRTRSLRRTHVASNVSHRDKRSFVVAVSRSLGRDAKSRSGSPILPSQQSKCREPVGDTGLRGSLRAHPTRGTQLCILTPCARPCPSAGPLELPSVCQRLSAAAFPSPTIASRERPGSTRGDTGSRVTRSSRWNWAKWICATSATRRGT